ncbi:MAG: hypothetical protein IJ002_00190 [Clostridia bacterium]|nr:hypothetical protein [Clostridia bacterium]
MRCYKKSIRVTGIYYGCKPPFAEVVSAGFTKGMLETHGTVLSASPH